MRPPNFPLTQLKGIHFKNPFVILPSPTPLTYPNGRVTPELLMHYKAFARTEAAMVIAGPATVVPPNSRKYSLLRSDQPKYMDGLRALSKIIESNGAIPGIQVVHPGDYDANQLMVTPRAFRGNPDDHVNERLVTVFRNACQRSTESGFRFVELGACDHLLLHQLIEEDRTDMVQEIFRECAKAVGDTSILGIRFNPAHELIEKYVRLFLEAGGDVVGYQAYVKSDQKLPTIRKQNAMVNLYQHISTREIRRLLESYALIALPTDFQRKSTQIYSLFEYV
jgi:2,4-dienoyl-CoA reductase-like NADH-dependent reductase (Old Yellow Enzyme family)